MVWTVGCTRTRPIFGFAKYFCKEFEDDKRREKKQEKKINKCIKNDYIIKKLKGNNNVSQKMF